VVHHHVSETNQGVAWVKKSSECCFRGKNSWRVLENNVLRRIFGPKEGE
jgi:hypothetical protein